MSQDCPSVTEILRAVGLGPDYSAVPEATLERASLRGQALHAAIAYHAAGVLDEASIHPEIAPGFSVYLKFLADSQHQAIASEIDLIHPAWHYRGHPDRIGFLGADRVLIDFKYMDSVDLAATAYQLAAYRLAWHALRSSEPIRQCFVLQLKHDGTYRLHELPKGGWAKAEQVFLAALVVYRARQEMTHE